jgi:hypothetical protein
MKLLIILAFLSGWLVTELKDIFTNGAYTNLMALALLKIMFISFLLLIVGGMAISANFFKNLLNKLISTPNTKFNKAMSSKLEKVFNILPEALDCSYISNNQPNGEE